MLLSFLGRWYGNRIKTAGSTPEGVGLIFYVWSIDSVSFSSEVWFLVWPASYYFLSFWGSWIFKITELLYLALRSGGLSCRLESLPSLRCCGGFLFLRVSWRNLAAIPPDSLFSLVEKKNLKAGFLWESLWMCFLQFYALFILVKCKSWNSEYQVVLLAVVFRMVPKNFTRFKLEENFQLCSRSAVRVILPLHLAV